MRRLSLPLDARTAAADLPLLRAVLVSDRRHQAYLKYGVAALITAINTSVYWCVRPTKSSLPQLEKVKLTSSPSCCFSLRFSLLAPRSTRQTRSFDALCALLTAQTAFQHLDSRAPAGLRQVHRDQQDLGPLREDHLPHRRRVPQLALRPGRQGAPRPERPRPLPPSPAHEPAPYHPLDFHGRPHHRHDVVAQHLRLCVSLPLWRLWTASDGLRRPQTALDCVLTPFCTK